MPPSLGSAIALLAMASCAPAVDTNAIAKTLTQLDEDWSRAAGAKDLNRVASFYAEDAIAYPPEMPVANGEPAAKKVWGLYFADSTFTISWTTTHAGAAASGDIGFTTGTYQDSFNGPDGTVVHETGKYVCIWKKQQDGSWKAVHDIWNSDAK